ncbi:tripartite tricarboxylate transporter TctA family protein, partial [Vibrio cholerae CP1035(8)]
QLCLVH